MLIRISRVFAKVLMLSALVVVAGCESTAAQPSVGQSPESQSSGQSTRDLAPDVLRQWVDARAGTGEPVHWVSEGGVYAYPTGEKLLGMIGFDSSRVIWPDDPSEPVMHLTRKTFAYTDPDTGEVLSEFNGAPVTPIAYPYQLMRYRFENGRIYGDVEQGVGDAVRQIPSIEGMRVRQLGNDTLAVTASVFLDFPIPGRGQYQAWENYDFFLHQGNVDEPHQMSWQRYGALPPFAADAAESGRAIYHLLSWRVEDTEDFPEQMLEWAKRDKPQWLTPPADLDEIRALQAGEAGEAWAR